MTAPAIVIVAAAWLLGSGPAIQDVEKVRTLYIAAAYEEALAAIPTPREGAVSPELEQFRALCLLALGREEEATASVERLVHAHPTFRPPAGETSPRMKAIFDRTRSRLVPEITRQVFADAKAAYDAKHVDTAETGFRRAMALIDSLPEGARAGLADLRLLAAGFLDLSVAHNAIAPAPILPPEKRRVEPAYVPPATIREDLPPWNPPDATAKLSEYVGLLRIMIGVDGSVQSAAMVTSSHPAYDVAVTRAARAWKYKPATRNGVPVVAQKDIQVKLVPR